MKAEHTGNVPLKISLLQNLSAVSKDMEDYQASIQYTRKSLQLIQLTKQMNNLPDLYANLYNSWKALDKFDSALYYHEMFKLSSDSLMDQKRIDKLAEVQAKFELNQKEKDLLALKNRSLEQSLEIAASRLRMNILLGGSFTLLIVLMMFWIGYRIKHRKDMIIREREIEKLQKEKEIQASHALIRGQENERKRLAQEIHDGVGVMLSSASMQLSSLTTDVPPAHLKAPLKKAEELIKNAGNSLRQMAQNLIPGVLTKFGLIEALKDFVEEVEESTPISIKLQISGKYTGLSDDKSLMIYRIVQELFNNTIKHAKASLVSLEINFLTEKLFLTYHDNGKGFDAEEIVFESKKPLLWAIDARLAFLHGEMKYVSSPGNGFSCQISVPTNPLPENN